MTIDNRILIFIAAPFGTVGYLRILAWVCGVQTDPEGLFGGSLVLGFITATTGIAWAEISGKDLGSTRLWGPKE